MHDFASYCNHLKLYTIIRRHSKQGLTEPIAQVFRIKITKQTQHTIKPTLMMSPVRTRLPPTLSQSTDRQPNWSRDHTDDTFPSSAGCPMCECVHYSSSFVAPAVSQRIRVRTCSSTGLDCVCVVPKCVGCVRANGLYVYKVPRRRRRPTGE